MNTANANIGVCMQRPILIFIVILFTTLAPCSASVASGKFNQGSYGFFSGNDLIAWLDAQKRADEGKSSGIDNIWGGTLYGYIAAVYEEYAISKGACAPAEKLGFNQLAAVVKKYLDANPERWSSGAHHLVYAAYQEVWSCDKSKN